MLARKPVIVSWHRIQGQEDHVGAPRGLHVVPEEKLSDESRPLQCSQDHAQAFPKLHLGSPAQLGLCARDV